MSNFLFVHQQPSLQEKSGFLFGLVFLCSREHPFTHTLLFLGNKHGWQKKAAKKREHIDN